MESLYLKAIKRVINSGQFILGKEVEIFEKSFAKYLKSKYCIGVNSGSDALYLSLRVLNIKSKRVLLPANTFMSTADAVVRAGCYPNFIDVDYETYNIDADKLEHTIKHRWGKREIGAIIPVHLYGRPCNMDRLIEISEDYDIPIVEDACQAHGATWYKKKVGTFGVMGCFSFYPSKVLGAMGDAGCIVTDNKEIASCLYKMRDYGRESKNSKILRGINSRLDEIQAAVLNEKLNYLDMSIEMRRKRAEYYNNIFNKKMVDGHVYHQYVIKVMPEMRENLRKFYNLRVHYPIPIHKQIAYSDHKDADLPITERLSKQILSLPIENENFKLFKGKARSLGIYCSN